MATTENLDVRFEEEARLLAAEFAGLVGKERVRSCVGEARARFADVRTEVFLPALVANYARRLLQEEPASLRAG